MSESRALAVMFETADKNFFKQHLDRKVHIRLPYKDECNGEFWSLGEHEKTRRRILLIRYGHDGAPLPDGKVLKIPFLAFSDETIEDRDDVLVPIVEQIMREAAAVKLPPQGNA